MPSKVNATCPRRDGCQEIPRALLTCQTIVTIKSRPNANMTIHVGAQWTAHNANQVKSESTLSQTGSSHSPNSPRASNVRASQPSTRAVRMAARKIQNAKKCVPWASINQKIRGPARPRDRVTALGSHLSTGAIYRSARCTPQISLS